MLNNTAHHGTEIKNCLLIVDVQKGFINAHTAHIPRLVEGLQSDYKYLFVIQFFNAANSLFRSHLHWKKITKDSVDYQLAFKPFPEAVLLNKSGYSCVDKSFIETLNSKNIEQVDVCGIDTDICVTKCAVDLFEKGIVPRVLTAYCASSAGHRAHTQAIKTLERFIGESQVIK